MLHDGGGDRSQTVAAVRRLISSLRVRGFRFVTVSELAGLSTADTEPLARGWSHTRGGIFVFSVCVAYAMTTLFLVVMLAVGVLVMARAVLLFLLAGHHVRLARGRSAGEYEPSVAIVVPAYNEEVAIERAVRSLAASDYPESEVVVIDDGSKDRTAEIGFLSRLSGSFGRPRSVDSGPLEVRPSSVPVPLALQFLCR